VSAHQRFLEALRAHGCRGGHGSWQCPSHADRSPSLRVREGDDGRVLIFCFAGCETAEVVAALGLRVRDLFEGAPVTRTPGRTRRTVKAKPAPPSPRCRIGLPTDDDLFWAQPPEVIDAHLGALPPGPSDEQVAAFLARRQREEAGRG
jgi:hypothetical protein